MPKRALWIAFVVLLLVTLPYVYAVLAGGTEHVFSGFLLNPYDGQTYLAKMYQGWRGDVRFTLPFTSDPGKGGYLNLFYLFLGHLARWTGLPLILVFHLARLFGAACMLFALWRFLTASMTNERWRLWAFTLAGLGLGLGWLVFAFGVITSDFWIAEAYPFLSAYTNPHFPLGLALLLYIFTLPVVVDQEACPRWLASWKVGIAAFLLSLISPFGVVVALVVLGGLYLWEIITRIIVRRRESYRYSHAHSVQTYWSNRIPIQRMVWVIICGVPLLVYDLWIVRVDPQLASWNAQNQTLTPPAWDLLLALSPALLLALPGAWRVIAHDQREARLLLVWVIVGMALIYAPFGLQRRFLMGLYVPLAGLAGYGLESLEVQFSLPVARRVAVIVLALALPTILISVLVGMYGIQSRDPALYITRGEAQALEWLERNTPEEALVLAAPETGLIIPAHTGRRVIYGHPYETVNAESEKALVVAFFQGDLSFPVDLLEQRQVNYIFYGPRERRLGELPRQIEIQPVFSAGTPGEDGVVIYQVVGAD